MLRALIERLSLREINDRLRTSRPRERIHHAQIICYSQVDPVSAETRPFFRWTRSVCPWDEQRSSASEWREFLRPTYSNEQLLGAAASSPRLFASGGPPRGAGAPLPGGLLARGEPHRLLGRRGRRRGRASTPGFLRRSSREAADAARAAAPPPRAQQAAPDDGTRPASAGLALKRVLLVTKSTRYASERKRHGGDDATLRRELERRGIAWQTLRRSADAHEFAFREITRALEAVGADVTVVDAHELDRERIAAGGFDLLLAAGGGGPVLRAAACIPRAAPAAARGAPPRHALPLVGVNTDPLFSTGALCATSIDFDDAKRAAGTLGDERVGSARACSTGCARATLRGSRAAGCASSSTATAATAAATRAAATAACSR